METEAGSLPKGQAQLLLCFIMHHVYIGELITKADDCMLSLHVHVCMHAGVSTCVGTEMCVNLIDYLSPSITHLFNRYALEHS